MSSSTSSSNSPSRQGVGSWRRFFRALAAWTIGLVGLLYGAIVVIDPFDTLIVSPPLDRVPIATNWRYSYPALARSDVFDSAVIGTSTSRLLRPALLNRLFGARFVNLSMNSATAYEQYQILDLFARHHREAKIVLIGIDVVWCKVGESYTRHTPRPFPEWMYDDNPWNDFREHFDFYTLEQAGRQFATMIGARAVKYGRDGYTNFLPDDATYDAAKVRRKLWGDRPAELVPVRPPETPSAAELATLAFPTHALMRYLLAALPAEARTILYFVPYHVSRQPSPDSIAAARWSECKKRMAAIAADYPGTLVVDFMRPSPITIPDHNYWDGLHYRLDVADLLAKELLAAASGVGGAAYDIPDVTDSKKKEAGK